MSKRRRSSGADVQVGRVNVASGRDRVAVQAGSVTGRRAEREPEHGPTGESGTGRVSNIRSGNARVGRQTDVVVGDLHINF